MLHVASTLYPVARGKDDGDVPRAVAVQPPLSPAPPHPTTLPPPWKAHTEQGKSKGLQVQPRMAGEARAGGGQRPGGERARAGEQRTGRRRGARSGAPCCCVVIGLVVGWEEERQGGGVLNLALVLLFLYATTNGYIGLCDRRAKSETVEHHRREKAISIDVYAFF